MDHLNLHHNEKVKDLEILLDIFLQYLHYLRKEKNYPHLHHQHIL
jgi:hypothetical protein